MSKIYWVKYNYIRNDFEVCHSISSSEYEVIDAFGDECDANSYASYLMNEENRWLQQSQ
jgi:hypothetical protein